MMNYTTFDESLPKFASIVFNEWGAEAFEKNFFLRDVSGRLTFIVLDNKHSKESRDSLAKKVHILLDHYTDADTFSVATPMELFDDRLINPSDLRHLDATTTQFKGKVKVLDRRMVGADWLREPVSFAKTPTRIAFTSIKGGVGRSTALCVAAAHFASHGKRVLTVDMDLEAPGLGNMLLPGKTLPKYGLLDYLVENSLNNTNEEFLVDMMGSSWISKGAGRVDVIPAIGQQSLDFPENVLAKIARAYLSTENSGSTSTFTDHINSILEKIATPSDYDLILIDCRAGLHETTAAGFLGLGAHVLLFGIDQPQTFAGYSLLFAHLNTSPSQDINQWLDRISFINAKTSAHEHESAFEEKIIKLLEKYSNPTDKDRSDTIKERILELKDQFEVDWVETTTEGEAQDIIDEGDFISYTSTLSDENYRFFDPISNSSLLEKNNYEKPYENFLKLVEAIAGTETFENDEQN